MGQLIDNSLQVSSLGAKRGGETPLPEQLAHKQRLSNFVGGTRGRRGGGNPGERGGGSVQDFQNGGKIANQETIIYIHSIA